MPLAHGDARWFGQTVGRALVPVSELQSKGLQKGGLTAFWKQGINPVRSPAGPKIHQNTSCGMLPGTSIVLTCCVEELLPLGQRRPSRSPPQNLRSVQNICSTDIHFSITWVFFNKAVNAASRCRFPSAWILCSPGMGGTEDLSAVIFI